MKRITREVSYSDVGLVWLPLQFASSGGDEIDGWN